MNKDLKELGELLKSLSVRRFFFRQIGQLEQRPHGGSMPGYLRKSKASVAGVK